MVPPTWLHERGQPRLKQPCPSCGREIPVLILPPDLLRFYGWQPFKVWSSVEWCGAPLLSKPFSREDLDAVLGLMMGPSRSSRRDTK